MMTDDNRIVFTANLEMANNDALKPITGALSEHSSPNRTKALLGGDPSEDEITSDEHGGVALGHGGLNSPQNGFKINEDFARRFEHNKKREELQRCQWALQYA